MIEIIIPICTGIIKYFCEETLANSRFYGKIEEITQKNIV